MGRDCKNLFLTKKQQKLCNRDDGMVLVLLDAFRLSLTECRQQFKHERWNCSMTNDAQRLNIVKEGRYIEELSNVCFFILFDP